MFVAFISTSEGAVPESLRNVLTETVVVPDSYPTLRERERLANILCDRMCAKEGTVFSPSLRAGYFSNFIKLSFSFHAV